MAVDGRMARPMTSDELGALGRLTGRVGARGPARGERLLAYTCAVVNRQLVPGIHEVASHVLAHRAESDPCNLHARQASWSTRTISMVRAAATVVPATLRPMATSADERRAQFRWMDKLSDEDVTAVPLAEPGTMLADLDEYVDATSPKRGRVISLEGEKVPVGGVYIVKSASPGDLWDRIGEAIR